MRRSPLPLRPQGRLSALLVALMLLTGCSIGGGAPSPAPEPASRPGPTRTAISSRPVQSVPPVRPAGFTSPPPGRGPSRYQTQPLSWKPCRRGLQCAQVRVPLDYARPDGTAITLALAKRPARRLPRRGTLFLNPGGPGASGLGYVSYFRSTGLEDYDVVGWDPRGVGESTPVSCEGVNLDRYASLDNSPDTPAEQQALIEANRQLGLDCLARSGVLLQHVSTVETARDLDLLRGLLGDRRLNFSGASYGTQIGATYAQLFAPRVGRMILDGAVNITPDRSVTQAQGFDRALNAFADWCGGQDCSLGHTRAAVLSSVSGLFARLDANPIRVGARQLTQAQAVAGVELVLYGDQSAYPLLLRALSQVVERGDGKLLLALGDQLNERDAQGRYGQINYAFPAIRCLDRHDLGVQGEVDLARAAARVAPVMGPVFGPDLVCPMWPVPAVPSLTLVGAGAAPILVLGNTGDPATPYEYAVSMARQLRSAVLVTFRGHGHTSYADSACVQRLVVAYLEQGTVPKDGTTC